MEFSFCLQPRPLIVACAGAEGEYWTQDYPIEFAAEEARRTPSSGGLEISASLCHPAANQYHRTALAPSALWVVGRRACAEHRAVSGNLEEAAEISLAGILTAPPLSIPRRDSLFSDAVR